MTTSEAIGRDPGPDLLAWPLLGSLLLRRRLWQGLMLAVSIVLIVHGFLGPQLAPKNLSTLVVWVHYRGLLIATLLLAGNIFCMACPFMLPRDLVRRFTRPVRAWPRALRGKVPGVVLFVFVLYTYELFDLWASPWATSLVIVLYFALAAAVDACFSGAPFCKSVCPIGQFNFVASTVSPLEVRARDSGTCATCSGHECLTGNTEREARGCETGLFLPEKVGNMDCTFCLDCARACPHDNVMLTTRLPGEELMDDRSGSGVGRRSNRGDLALLALVFTFGALLNAFGMVSPVYAFQQGLAAALGTTSEAAVLGVLFGIVLCLEPALLLGGAAALSRRALPARLGLWTVVVRFAHGLVPLGVGVWAAHYGFHLLTGLWTFVPVAQKAAADAGLPLLGVPRWGVGGLREGIVQPIEMGLLGLGTVVSLVVLWSIARREAPRRTLAAYLPWAIVALALCASAVWLLSQPMEMRGTFLES